jgi:predicted  nucleic acid-binding Zn-ribbon protein
MQIEQFRILREINSLHIELNKNKDLITEQNNRVTSLEKRIQDSSQNEKELELNLKKLRREVQQLENNIQEVQVQLDQSESHINEVTSQEQEVALKNQIKNFKADLANMEDDCLEKIQEQEEVESDLSDEKEFQIGAEGSLKEISNEVNEKVEELENDNKNLKSRIKLLIEDLLTNSQAKIKKLLNKNLPNGNLAYIKNMSCEACGLGMSHVDEQDVEERHQIKSCSGCGRIFLPRSINL